MKKIILAISILAILTACSSSDSKSNDSTAISKLKTINNNSSSNGKLKDLKVEPSTTNGDLKQLNNSLTSTQNSNNSGTKSTTSYKSVFTSINGSFLDLEIQNPKDNFEKIRINGKTTNRIVIKGNENFSLNENYKVELGENFSSIIGLISVGGNFKNNKMIEGRYIPRIIEVSGGVAENRGTLNPSGGIAMFSDLGKAYNNGNINNGSMVSDGIDSFIYNNKEINNTSLGMKASDLGYAENNGSIIITGDQGIGMYATGDGSKIVNNGDIYLKGKNEIGMEVEDNAILENNGTIHLYKEGANKNIDISGNKAIENNGGTIVNSGIIKYDNK